MAEITEDVRAIVEDTELPRRLKEEVYDSLRERGDVTLEQVDDIARAVESKYVDTRVDPLDPVGTVSAQSIGEPGTQMSLDATERVLVKRGSSTEVSEIKDIVDPVIESSTTHEFDDHEVALGSGDLEVLSLAEDETVSWKTVEEVSRHDAPDEILEFRLESGRDIRATKAHSFVTRRDNEVVPVAEEAGVQMALHPDDPPISPIRGVPRLVTSVENYRRILDLYDSPNHGLTFCQGNFAAMGADVPAAIEEFSQKIHFVHFRDVEGTADSFVETWHDDGPTDMQEAIDTYQRVGFDAAIRPDHVPRMLDEQDRDAAMSGYTDMGRLFAVGYMRGLLE